MIIRSKAPLRISFGGGGTDVSPYFEERGGCVLCATIDKFSYATLIDRQDSIIRAHSLDHDTLVKYSLNEPANYDGKLDLVKGVAKVMEAEGGLDLYLHNDILPGSGLGSSSSLTVALVGLLKHWKKQPLTDYDVAELAYQIERTEVGISGGKQDQYAATFGNFNFIEFFKDSTIVNVLRIKDEVLNELEYRLMLCYVGKRHLSAGIIDDQVKGYVEGKEDVVRSLDATKELAIRMKNALLLGQLNNFGAFLDEGWCLKKKFSKLITDSHIDELYEVSKKSGAIGGKLLGAGGGGFLLVFCEFNKWHKVAQNLEQAGGKVVNFAFEFKGLQTWEVNNNNK